MMRRQGGVVRLWGFGLHSVLCVLEGAGDGRSGALLQDLFGTYADDYASAAVLPFPSRMPWETCRRRGRLCAGASVIRISARPLCGTAFDSRPSRENGVPPLITTAE